MSDERGVNFNHLQSIHFRLKNSMKYLIQLQNKAYDL